MQLGEIAKANPEVAIGSYPRSSIRSRGQHECSAARFAMDRSLRRPNARLRACWGERGERNQRAFWRLPSAMLRPEGSRTAVRVRILDNVIAGLGQIGAWDDPRRCERSGMAGH
jgi:hypothetical protein